MRSHEQVIVMKLIMAVGNYRTSLAPIRTTLGNLETDSIAVTKRRADAVTELDAAVEAASEIIRD